MNVFELIKKLEKLDPEMEVVITTDNFEQAGSMKIAERFFTFCGKRTERNFRDAFDGEAYTTTVIDYVNNKEPHNFVKIG